MPGFNVGGIGDGPSNEIDPFYTYTWEISQLFGDNIAEDSALIWAKDLTLPTFTARREEVEGASLVYKFASNVSWDDVRITFYDIPGKHTQFGDGPELLIDVLRAWRHRVWTPERGVGMADDVFVEGDPSADIPGPGTVPHYKHPSRLQVFNSDMSAGYSWLLWGSWPSSVKEGDLTYTNSDVKIVEVILAYDWAESGALNDPAAGMPDFSGIAI